MAANLVESARKFRWAIAPFSPHISLSPASSGEELEVRKKPLGQEYLEMVQDGVVAAQYIQSWQIESEDADSVSPGLHIPDA